jgi:hypothetical protein
LIGLTALAAGFLLYLGNRPSDTYFVSALGLDNSPHSWNQPFLRTVGGFLPSFLHVFAFSLLLGGLLGCRKTGCLIICCGWFFTNVLFELGQRYASSVSKIVPEWFEGLFILENAKSFFLRGTFDPFDILASLVGAVAAYAVLVITMKDKVKDAFQRPLALTKNS